MISIFEAVTNSVHSMVHRLLARARALDPLDPRLAVREGVVAFIFGQFEQAEEIFRELFSKPEAPPIAPIGLMETLHRAGRKDEAAAVARELSVDSELPNVGLAVSGGILAQCGAEDEARERLWLLESRIEPGSSVLFFRAVIHVALGEIDEAFALYDEAVEDRDGALLYLIVLPKKDGFQDDPRFGALLRQIGLGHLVATG